MVLLSHKGMDKILTIVIPSYNMEQYIATCLESLLVKENRDSLEVLIINDGSKDKTLYIANEYAEKYPELFRVIDKPNGNYGSCVNKGLKEAQGKYIKILDADDQFDTERFDAFIKYLLSVDADLVLSDFAVIDLSGTVRKIIHYDWGTWESGKIEDVCMSPVFIAGMQMHAVTYRRQCLLDIDYKQTEGISYTDQQWIFIPMSVVRTVIHYNDYVYKYLIGREGQTVDPNVKIKSIRHTLQCVLGMVDAYEQNKERFTGKPIKKYLDDRLFWFAKSVYAFCFMHYNAETTALLQDFDLQIQEASTEVYDRIGSKEMSSIMGFCFIDYWRRHRNIPMWIVKTLGKVYMMVLSLKSVLPKDEDPMAIPTSF